MNLEELKQSWQVLNERLAQNEVVNQRIIRDMVVNKTQTAYDKIFSDCRRELFITLLIGAFLLPLIQHFTPTRWSAFVFLESFLFVGFLYQVYSLYTLSRFDLSRMSVKSLMHTLLCYKRLYIYNMIYGIPLALLAVAIFFVLHGVYSIYAIGMVLLFTLINMVNIYFSHRKHSRQIREVETTLAELQEMQGDE